jgi:RimJ/RimL family protein N-acetyltransferase
LQQPPLPNRPNFLIFLRDTAELVGGIGLKGENRAELGYWVARAHWGEGIASEAGQAVVDLCDASLRLQQLESSYAIDNPASGNVLAKLGFRPNGATAELYSLGRSAPMTVRLCARERVAAVPAELTPMAA